jgi:hypothetical protein
MKSIGRIFSIISLLVITSHSAFASEDGRRAFPFTGQWRNVGSSITYEEGDLQDIQNMRRDGNQLVGVKGHTEINTSVWSGSRPYPRNMFHYSKSNPEESFVFVQAGTSSDTSTGYTYDNPAVVPAQGDFSATRAIPSDTNGGLLGRFAQAPQDFLAYANGDDHTLWNGAKAYPLEFLIASEQPYRASVSSRSARSSITDGNGDTYATIGGDMDEDLPLFFMSHFDGTNGATSADDESPNDFTITFNGNAQLDTTIKKFGTASLELSSAGNDTISTPDSDNVAFGSDPFTIEFWVYWNNTCNLASSSMVFMTQYQDVSHFLEAGYNGSADNFYMEWTDSHGADALVRGHKTVAADTWYHVVYTRDSDTRCRIFVDGVDITDHYNDSERPFSNKSGVVRWGAQDASGTKHITGGSGTAYLDEIRVVIGAAKYTHYIPTSTLIGYDGQQVHMLVGSVLPLEDITFTIDQANTLTSTMDVWQWQYGSGWVHVAEVDGTASGGVALAQTGTVSWSTYESADPLYLNGLSLYWYKFSVDRTSETHVTSVTMNSIAGNNPNHWDGALIPVAQCLVRRDESAALLFDDYTTEIQAEEKEYYMPLGVMDILVGEVLVAFTDPVQGMEIGVVEDKANSTNCDMTVEYWNGGKWAEFQHQYDGTSLGSTIGGDSFSTLARSGAVIWETVDATEDYPWEDFSDYTEYPRQIGASGIDLYWYKLTFNAALSNEVDVYNILGIPRGGTMSGDYDFPAVFKNRLLLARGNRMHYSAFDKPYVFNGADSDWVYFGDNAPLTAASPLYNVYLSTGVDQLIVAKRNSVFRLEGSGPDDWEVQQITSNIGCVAPLSMVTCGATDVGANAKRHIVVFQGANGVYACDGANVQLISGQIGDYWDSDSDVYIPADRQDDSVAWYDPELHAYKLLISSGSEQAEHNVELEYSLEYGQWTKIYRENDSGANPLQAGCVVTAQNGVQYTYGATNEGVVYRLENGSDWNGDETIEEYVWTKDMLFAEKFPFFSDSRIDWVRLAFEDRAVASPNEAIEFQHYCDGSATTDGVQEQYNPADTYIHLGPVYTTDCNLGPCHYHSMKISCDTDDVGGLALDGIGFVFESYDTISQ